MSIFDRKRPLKTLKRYMSRFFTKKSSERVDFIDTTRPVQMSSEEMGSPGTGGYNDNDPEELNPNDDSIVSTQSIIQDKDKDTKVDTEESTDEDKIRFDTGGNERFRMEGNDTSGGALYIKEGAGTTAPSTPSSGEGVFYEKNDGKIYFKNDGGTEYDLTSGGGGGGGSMSSWTLSGDSGSSQTITDANTVDIEGGTGINTVAGATDKVTINCDLEGTELKSTGETGGNKFLREDGDGTCSWAITSGSGGTVQGSDGTYDIEAANQGAVAGNSRGENSVDLQTERDNATEVASGVNSTLIAGENNTASAAHSSVIGGNGNTASASYSAVVGNLDSTASGTYSGVFAGRLNTASGSESVVIGGQSNVATGINSVATGIKADSKRYGEFAVGGAGSSNFTAGEAQAGTVVFAGRTTNAAATVLYLADSLAAGAGYRFTIDTDSLVTFEIQLSCIDETAPGTINAGATFVGSIVNDSGTTALAGQGSVTKTANPSTTFAAGGADANVTADNTNNALKITVEGITGKNMKWVCVMRYSEVKI
tara:strand:+ start:97 stop:1710 length:1614 start_codon:yes stop_codon:yes gene_type:complete